MPSCNGRIRQELIASAYQQNQCRPQPSQPAHHLASTVLLDMPVQTAQGTEDLQVIFVV